MAIAATRRAEYSIVELALPGRALTNVGVLLLDPETGELYPRLREDSGELAGEDDAEVLALLPEDIAARAREMGGAALFEWLEDCLSNALRITGRRAAMVRDFPAARDRLFARHVLAEPEPAQPVRPYVTHLPLYPLRAAAGGFGADMEAGGEQQVDWIAAPPGLRLGRDLFAVHVTGRSMEPLIPNGAIAVFRRVAAGSRQGKRVLVWRGGTSEGGGEFTIKVYRSRKRPAGGTWEHSGIRLDPLNPEYAPIELDQEGEYRVLAEYVATLAVEDADTW